MSRAIQPIRSPYTTRLDLDQLLERLDGEAHRRGRLNPGLVRGAMHKAAVEANVVNSTQALLLIRCTGSLLVSELPQQRQQVLDHMMNVFKHKNVTFDVTHYNSYMRVSLQNHHFFDPVRILQELKTAQVAPNLTTFRLLVECYARQGRSDDIQSVLAEMKKASLNIEPVILTHLLNSYAEKGDVERVETLFGLFDELTLKPISETYEQFVIAYLKRGQTNEAKKYFVENVSKMNNDSLFRLIVTCAQCRQKDLFELVINAIDKNSLADICVQYILCATDLLDANLDDYAFLLIDSFPKRDETLRFDVINLTLLNLLKLRLPTHHFRPFSTFTPADIDNHLDASTNYQCERESVADDLLHNFRQLVLKRVESFPEKKDRWLAVHQLLYHAYQSHLPLPYIYSIYDSMRQQNYEYRPHYIRPVLAKLPRICSGNASELTNQTRELLDFLHRKFSVGYDAETIDVILEHLFERCRLNPSDIGLLMKQANINLNQYWQNLYLATMKRINIDLLKSLVAFLQTNKTIRFEYTPIIREQTVIVLQSLINQLSVQHAKTNPDEALNHLKVLIEFVETINKRFVKNPADVMVLNDTVLTSIVSWFLEEDQKTSIDLMKKVVKLFEQRAQAIPLTKETKERIYQRLGMQSMTTVNDQLARTLKRTPEKRTDTSPTPPANQQTAFDDSNAIFVKLGKNPRNLTIRELEDQLVDLKRRKLNTSGVVSRLLTKYCAECSDFEHNMSTSVRESYMQRVAELEAIYFDKKQTSGFPSLAVIAALIDYYSRVELNLDKVIRYINLSAEIDPKFKLDPHKSVSVVRLLIRRHAFDKAIELIDSLGRHATVPNYMFRRVRDLLLDAYSLLSFEQFQQLTNKLLENNYVDPSSVVLALIVRKAYQESGPLQAFETVTALLVRWNNLVGIFPIVRKLLRDDCTEELKQVLIKIGKMRSRTYAYEQLAFSLIHERRFTEAVKVCQNISRSTFDEHCQRYVRELFPFPTDFLQIEDEPTSAPHVLVSDIHESNHVFDVQDISLVNFIDFIEQYPTNARQLCVDTLFYTLFKSFEKAHRLDEFTKLMREYSSKYANQLSTKTKDAFSHAGISVPIKSLSSPKQSKKRIQKHERFFQDHDYDDEASASQNPF